MRIGKILLALLSVFLLICGIASAENAGSTDLITYDEWDWDNESVNTFTGSLDLSQWRGTEVTLEMKAAFEPNSEAASEIIPKFTHINGSRLTMLEQRDNFTWTPETDQAVISFSGSLQMPEKDHYQKITIDLKAVDPEDKVLKKTSVTISKGGSGSSQTGSIFYIPFEIRTAAIIIAAAAAVVWCLAVFRNRVLNRKK